MEDSSEMRSCRLECLLKRLCAFKLARILESVFQNFLMKVSPSEKMEFKSGLGMGFSGSLEGKDLPHNDGLLLRSSRKLGLSLSRVIGRCKG